MSECPTCGHGSLRRVWGSRRWVYHDYEGETLRCDFCGSWSLSPLPSAAYLARIYSPNYFVEASLVEEPFDSKSHGELDLAWVLTKLVDLPDGPFVDWGCGTGSLVEALSEAGRYSIGVEVDETHVRQLRDIGIEAVELRAAQTLDGKCAAVHLADVLEHVRDPLDTLSSALGLLRPEGLILIQGPLEGDQDLFARCLRMYSGLAREPIRMPPWHLHQFSLSGFRMLLSRAGIASDIETRTVSWPAPRRFADCQTWRDRALVALRKSSVLHGKVRRVDSANRVMMVGTVQC